jgi:Cu(I)/Ag(I) efflux system protein CusF
MAAATQSGTFQSFKENTMKHSILLLALLLAGCKAPSSDAGTAATSPRAMPPAQSTAASVTMASASGLVQAVDIQAKTVTIAHGPVDVLKWPAMTMTFQAPDTDMNSIKPGDRVNFEFTSTGMNGTITAITHQ